METTDTKPITDSRPRWLLRLFAPDAPAPAITDPAQVTEAFRTWRMRVLVSAIIGYATFYLVRKNLAIAMPVMEKDLGITKTELGVFLTLHGVFYGVSKFFNGLAADRSSARAFMVVGLVASAIMNILFGLSTAGLALGVAWMVNGWVQGFGFPACARLMTHWFPPKQLATKMSIWNTSHSIGAGAIVVLCGYLVTAGWRWCFFVPSAIALLSALYLWRALPDTPPSVGLPETEGTENPGSGAEKGDDFKAFLMENVFRNPTIWLISLANFFVYVIRYAVLDWGPTLLTETKGVHLTHAGWMVAACEVSGLFGMLSSGWITDRVFGGRGVRACAFCMAFSGAAIFFLWKSPAGSVWLNTALLCAAGFFIYGPQALVGIIAANLGTKRAAATAGGFTGMFGYFSTVLSGWGLGALVEREGWNAGFAALIVAAAIGTVLFALAWRSKPHGYKEAPGSKEMA